MVSKDPKSNTGPDLQPFDESRIQDHFWDPEPWDKLLPSPGFLTDFILHLRGIMTPTSFCFWSGVFVVSNILQRDAWLRWFPDPLFPNFFIVFVAPPRVCAKSSAVRFGEKLLYKYTEKLNNPALEFMKEPRILNKATPEALNDTLNPVTEKVKVGEKIVTLNRGSSATIIVSELANFLGKQKYNAGLTEKLIDLYDCKDKNREGTRAHGIEEQKNTFVTLFGATTIEGLEESIPSVAMAGGFISRLIIDYHTASTRWTGRRIPKPVIGGPTQEDLLERMAWIAQNAYGEYTLSPEADDYYAKRYEEIGELLSIEENLRKRDMNQRYDIHLVKLALLIRAQRYTPGTVIELQDIMEADQVLRQTFSRNHEVTAEVGVSLYQKGVNRVVDLIRKKGSTTRRQVLQASSPYGVNAEILTRILDQLSQEGRIKITLGGKERVYPSRKGHEVYHWRGKRERK